MKICLEEIKKEDGFITVLDDDGMVTIQMSEDSVKKIIEIFDNHIINKEECKKIVEVTEYDNTFKLELSLKNDDDGFSLTGNIVDSNFYHDFELEYCNNKTWNKIKKLCQS